MNNTIGLVGDYNEKVQAHIAIPKALTLANSVLNSDIKWTWLETSSIKNKKDFQNFHAIWVTPGSPYVNMEGVLECIQFARESKRPFLGTCGGFQHALIEFARNVCGEITADHAESNPKGNTLVITPLICSLNGKSSEVFFKKNSSLSKIFNTRSSTENYQCNYGLNPNWKKKLESNGLHFTGFDADHNVRAFELPDHPFFIGTLFQPELLTLSEKLHPLVKAFVSAANNFSN